MASLPPSIANASREQLQQFLIDALKKLKLRDKKIEELQQGDGSGSSKEEVSVLQQRLLSSERAFEARLEAEKELISSEWKSKLQELTHAHEEITAQLVARERYAAKLEADLEGAQAETEEARKSASQQAALTDRASLEKEEIARKATEFEQEVSRLQEELQAVNRHLAEQASKAPEVETETSTAPELEALWQRIHDLETENSRLREAEDQVGSELLARLAAVSSAKAEVLQSAGETEGVLAAMDVLHGHVSELEGALAEREGALAELEELQARTESNRAVAAKETDTLRQQLQHLEQQLDANNKLPKEQPALEECTGSEEKEDAELVTSLRARIEELTTELEKVKSQENNAVAVLERRAEELAMQLADKDQELAAALVGLKEVNGSHSSSLDEHREEVQALRSELERTIASTAAERANLEDQLATATSQLAEAERVAASLRSELDTLHGAQAEEAGRAQAELEKKLAKALEEARAEAMRAESLATQVDEAKGAALAAQKEHGNELSELQRTLGALRSETDTQLATLRAELESSRLGSSEVEKAGAAELGALRKQQEVERARVKRALGDLRRRLDTTMKEKESMEEVLQSELDTLRARASELEDAGAQTAAALEATKNELRDYRARAHALLKHKDDELAGAAAAAREESEATLREAEERARCAESEVERVREELARADIKVEEALEAVRVSTGSELAALRQDLVMANEAAEAARRGYAQLRVRHESLEMRWAAATAEVDALRTEAAKVLALQRVADEAARRCTEFQKQHEESVLELELVRHKLKQKEAQHQLSETIGGPRQSVGGEDELILRTGGTNGFGSIDSSGNNNNTMGWALPPISNGVSHAGGLLGAGSDLQSTLLSSEQRVRELEQEISELEKECSLREEQEEALKETVRELGRELDRVRVAGQKADMEYFKNVMLKLFETGETASLLPVVATVLKFSPEELHRCQKATEKWGTHRTHADGGDMATYLAGWASWLGSSEGQ